MMFPGTVDYGYMAWMMFGSVVLWVALIAFVAFVFVKLMAGREGDDAVEMLKQRLARGEINAEEFQSRRALLIGR
ncbi:MAG TPA: SHOCT domain-containing protein [Candidatus Limnocylindria bacterium]